MARAGQFRERAYFERLDKTAVDVLDNPATDAWTAIGDRPARLIPMRGNEKPVAGSVAGVHSFELRVRSSAFTRSITTHDRVKVDGVVYQIRATHETEKPGLWVYALERGVAQ